MAWDSKAKHAWRRGINAKFKYRDRWKSKAYDIPWHRWRHDPTEKDWTFNRRKAPTATGYGVAYEDNPDAGKY